MPSFRVGSKCALNVDAMSADVTVEGWEQPEVMVAASPDQVIVHQQEETLSVRPTALSSADLVIHVPRQCDVTLHLVSGDAVLQHVAGRITAQTMSGDVTAGDVQGSVHAHSVSGDVVISASRLKDLTVDTVSGDMTLETELDQEGNYSVRTVSGDLRLRVPEDQRCTVHCYSLSGAFESSLPYESKHSGWGKLEALINGGGVEFRVRTASGNVRVEAASELPEAAPAEAEPGPQPEPALQETKPLTAQPEEPEPFAIDEDALADYEEAGLSPAAKRMRILKAIEEGRLSVSDGLEKLRSIE